MTYGVEITETLQRVVYIETDSEESAIDAVREMVDTDYIVLGPDDFTGRDYSIYSVEPKANKVDVNEFAKDVLEHMPHKDKEVK